MYPGNTSIPTALKSGSKPPLSQLQDTGYQVKHSNAATPSSDGHGDIDPKLFNENMTLFSDTWIPDTMRIFAPTGAAIHTRGFWSSQMRNELDHRLWRPQHLGREATDEELDWLVESAMEMSWPHIEKILDGQSCEKQVHSPLRDLDGSTACPVERKLCKSPTRTKLRRAFALEDMMEQTKIGEIHDEDGEERCAEFEVEHVEWEIVNSSTLEQGRQGEEHKKKEVRKSRVGKPTSQLEDLDDDTEKRRLTPHVTHAKEKARPALASSLLKKTLRGT